MEKWFFECLINNLSLICIICKNAKMPLLVLYLTSTIVLAGYHYPPLATSSDHHWQSNSAKISTTNFPKHHEWPTLRDHYWWRPPPTITPSSMVLLDFPLGWISYDHGWLSIRRGSYWPWVISHLWHLSLSLDLLSLQILNLGHLDKSIHNKNWIS